jgi:phenylalanyl-tRNA synthetase beta chain
MICGAMLGYTLEDIRTTLDTYIALVLPGQTVHIRNNENAPAYMHPGVCGQYMVDGNVCITFGRVHPSVAASFCISPDTYIWEGDYEYILSLSRHSLLSYKETSRYQHIPRELNFVMPERTPTGDIATYIQSLHTYIHDIVVIDTYRDPVRIGEGKKSITYRFDLSSTS